MKKVAKVKKTVKKLVKKQVKVLAKKIVKKEAKQVKVAKKNKKDVVQIKNPKTGLYVKINRAEGKIMSYKKTPGAYANVKSVNKTYLEKNQNIQL